MGFAELLGHRLRLTCQQHDCHYMHNICHACRAFAKLAYVPCEPFLAAAALQLLTDLPRCVPQDISNATWAFATLRHHPGNTLMDACAQTAARTMPHFKPQEIANTLW